MPSPRHARIRTLTARDHAVTVCHRRLCSREEARIKRSVRRKATATGCSLPSPTRASGSPTRRYGPFSPSTLPQRARRYVPRSSEDDLEAVQEGGSSRTGRSRSRARTTRALASGPPWNESSSSPRRAVSPGRPDPDHDLTDDPKLSWWQRKMRALGVLAAGNVEQDDRLAEAMLGTRSVGANNCRPASATRSWATSAAPPGSPRPCTATPAPPRLRGTRSATGPDRGQLVPRDHARDRRDSAVRLGHAEQGRCRNRPGSHARHASRGLPRRSGNGHAAGPRTDGDPRAR